MKKLIPFIPILGMFLVPYLWIKYNYDLGLDKPFIFFSSSVLQAFSIGVVLIQIFN